MRKIALLLTIIMFFAACGNDSDVVILSVNDVQSDPTAFTGEITINGVVSGFYEDNPNIIYIKDTAEQLFCKNLFCDAPHIPIIYTGTTPTIADEVNVIGEWGDYNGVLIFEAAKLEVKQNLRHVLNLTDWGDD
jgi:hypothetical protein